MKTRVLITDDQADIRKLVRMKLAIGHLHSMKPISPRARLPARMPISSSPSVLRNCLMLSRQLRTDSVSSMIYHITANQVTSA